MGRQTRSPAHRNTRSGWREGQCSSRSAHLSRSRIGCGVSRMSVYVSTDVWKYSKATGGAFVVLLCLADQANDDGLSWWSVPKIAVRCRMSERSVRRHLIELRAIGEVEIEWREGHSNRFTVTVGDTAKEVGNHATEDVDPGQSVTPANLSPLTNQVLTPDNLAATPATVGRHNHQKRQEPSKGRVRGQGRRSRAGGPPSPSAAFSGSGYRDWEN
jgi:hypothetical protein